MTDAARPLGRVGLIIVAAGSGSRLGAAEPKAFVPLAGEPILAHAVRGALACPGLVSVAIVAPASHLDHAQTIVASVAAEVPVCVVAGGATRGESVSAGLTSLSDEVDFVLVHDAARCLTPHTVFAAVVAALTQGVAAAIPCIPVVDTVKVVDDAGFVVSTPDRSRLRAVQTPQGFQREVLLRAHALTTDATDDAALVEALGEAVQIVPGDQRALKVTNPEDLAHAERLLSAGSGPAALG